MNGRASYGASLVQLARLWIAWFRLKLAERRLRRLGPAINRRLDMTRILLIAALVIAICAATFTAHSYGYNRGASVGYQAGVTQDRIYQRGGSMASDWRSCVATPFCK